MYGRGVIVVPQGALKAFYAYFPSLFEVPPRKEEVSVSHELGGSFVLHLLRLTKGGKLNWEPCADRIYTAHVGDGEVFLWVTPENEVCLTVKLESSNDCCINDIQELRQLWKLVSTPQESPMERYMRTVIEEGDNATDGIKQ